MVMCVSLHICIHVLSCVYACACVFVYVCMTTVLVRFPSPLSVLLDPLLFKVFGSRFPEYKFSFTKKASQESSPAGMNATTTTQVHIRMYI